MDADAKYFRPAYNLRKKRIVTSHVWPKPKRIFDILLLPYRCRLLCDNGYNNIKSDGVGRVNNEQLKQCIVELLTQTNLHYQQYQIRLLWKDAFWVRLQYIILAMFSFSFIEYDTLVQYLWVLRKTRRSWLLIRHATQLVWQKK